MMGRLLVVLLFLLLIACPSFAGQPYFSAVVSVTDTNTTTEIAGVRGESVLLINDGPGTVYFNVSDIPVATATGAGLGAGESIVMTAGGTPLFMTHVGLICAAGQNSTVRIFAFPTR